MTSFLHRARRTACSRAAAAALLALFCGCPPSVGPDAGDPGGPQAPACEPACRESEACVDGACEPRTCDNVRCLAGTTCVRGRCYPLDCLEGPCGEGRVCDGRACVEAACAGVECPYGACVDGGCPSCSQLEYFEPDAGACVRRKAPGAACAQGGECTSGFCTGGVCCDGPCRESCEECSTGTCALRPALDPGSPGCFPGRCSGRSRACPLACAADQDCAPGAFCDRGQCQADLSNGAGCDRAAQCASGFCVQGNCCDSACNGPCSGCTALAWGGGGWDAGACHPVPPTHSYSACHPFACDPRTTGCPSTCATDDGCWSGLFCGGDGGCLVKKRPGGACARDAECTTGRCANGFCCNSGCSGGCSQCLADAGCAVAPDGTADAGCPNGGVCAQGQCCNRDCRGQCERCDLLGKEGTCAAAFGRQDRCNGYYQCLSDGGCASTCSAASGCAEGGWCNTTSRQCEQACDPQACFLQDPDWCCLDNVCQAPPPFTVCF